MERMLKTESLRGIRYALTGGGTMVVDLGVFYTLAFFYGTDAYLEFAIVSKSLAFLCNFTGHKFFTFQSRTRTVRNFVFHLCLKLTSAGLSIALLFELVSVIGLGIWVNSIIVPVIGAATFLMTRWIFTGSTPLELIRYLYSLLCRYFRQIASGHSH